LQFIYVLSIDYEHCDENTENTPDVLVNWTFIVRIFWCN